MFIGHFAVGLYGKKLAPRTSLGTWFVAAQFLDLLWPLLLLLGVEHVRIAPGDTTLTPLDFYDYPWSHSLLLTIGWGAVFGTGYYLFRKNLRTAVMLGIAVISHWVLDLVVHRPDLPLTPWGSERMGFGLWNTPAIALTIESIFFSGAVWLYSRDTQPSDRIGRFGWIGLAATLLLIWAGNFMGPPPPDTNALAVVANAQWLFVLWAYWVDRHRAERPLVSINQ